MTLRSIVWVNRRICRNVLYKLFRWVVRGYQYVVSPMLPMSCRFYPTCSDYALSAVEHYGMMKGLWMAFGRVLRCHPWSDGGCDPVLPNKEKR